MRTTEGEFGDLFVTIVANLTPNKAAKIIKFPLRPLSLHNKVHVLTDEDLARPRNRIRFTGQIPLSTSHEWIQALLPEVPPRIADDAVDEKCFYKNSFTGACTICEYRKNEVSKTTLRGKESMK